MKFGKIINRISKKNNKTITLKHLTGQTDTNPMTGIGTKTWKIYKKIPVTKALISTKYLEEQNTSGLFKAGDIYIIFENNYNLSYNDEIIFNNNRFRIIQTDNGNNSKNIKCIIRKVEKE